MWIGSPLRGAFRLLSYLLLTLVLLPIYLFARTLGIQPIVRWMPVVYHRVVCVILGIKVRVHGQRSDVIPTLYVCNHVSYLDIEVLGSLIPGSFVAKAEVATWPFFRTLAKAQRTIFIERRSGKTSKSRDEMMNRLNTGDNLMLFPEGTSSDGNTVLPFKSALLGAAEARLASGAHVKVQPVSAAFTGLHGMPMGRENRPLFAWYGDMEMVSHLWEALQAGPLDVVVQFHEPLSLDVMNRKALAASARQTVQTGLAQALAGRA